MQFRLQLLFCLFGLVAIEMIGPMRAPNRWIARAIELNERREIIGEHLEHKSQKLRIATFTGNINLGDIVETWLKAIGHRQR